MTVKKVNLFDIGLEERNTVVARRFAKLSPGDALEVEVDAPPWVLYHQLHTTQYGEMEWELLEDGPKRWSFRVTKRPAGESRAD